MKKSKRIALLALLLALTVILSLIPIRVSSATLALTLLPVFVLALTQDILTGMLGGLVMGVTSLVMAFTLNAGSPTAPIFQNPLVSVLPRILVPLAAFGVMKGLSAAAMRIRAKRAEKTAAEGCPPPDTPSHESDGSAPTELPTEEHADACPSEVRAEESAPVAKTEAPRERLPRLLQALIDGLACLVGVLTNTGAVLGIMWAVYGGKSVNDTLISPEFMSAMLSVNFVIEVILFPLVTPPIVYAVRKSARK